jgi:hypothetical protein
MTQQAESDRVRACAVEVASHGASVVVSHVASEEMARSRARKEVATVRFLRIEGDFYTGARLSFNGNQYMQVPAWSAARGYPAEAEGRPIRATATNERPMIRATAP